MDVVDRLATVGPVIDDYAIAVVQTLVLGHLLGHQQQMAQQLKQTALFTAATDGRVNTAQTHSPVAPHGWKRPQECEYCTNTHLSHEMGGKDPRSVTPA